LMSSPVTNTLPVRRLHLVAGEAQVFDVAWVVLPGLQVQRARQEYLRIDGQRVRYRSVESGFTATVRLDEDGFVIDYPPYWRRPRSTKNNSSSLSWLCQASEPWTLATLT